MNIYYEAFSKLSHCEELNHALKNGRLPASVTGLSAIHKAHLLAYYGQMNKILCICDDEASASKMAADVNSMADSEIAVVFPQKDYALSGIETASPEYEHQRIRALSQIIEGKAKILLCSAEAATQPTIPPETLRELSLTVKAGDIINTRELAKKLTDLGYVRFSQVEGRGQYSIRGDIIDIYPVNTAMPIRIGLWGEDVDTVSVFDIESQRRIDTVKSIVIAPAKELIVSPAQLAEDIEAMIERATGKLKDEIKKNLYADLDRIKGGATLASLDKYYGQIYGEPFLLTDYFKDGLCVISEYSNCIEKAKAFSAQLTEDLKILYEDGLLFKEMSGFYVEFPEVMAECEKLPLVYLDMFMHGSQIKLKSLISAEAYQSSTWGGDLNTLTDELKSYVEREYCVIILTGTEKSVSFVMSDVGKQSFKVQPLTNQTVMAKGMVYVGSGSLTGGAEYPEIGLAIISQQRAQSTRRKLKKKQKSSEKINSLADISRGDLVVHALHGIGRFEGIKSITTGKVTKDYITIKYAGTDVLYVPVTQLDIVSKYIGPKEDDGVKLNKLGGDAWQKTRARVKKACKDMADELIAIYAKRQLAKGYAFSKDSEWQMEFEERFDYRETDDQLRSVDEIKSDMEKATPMDRLLCGDVGFGKTEVALRAAMKCILDSKQCVILVPTTVLAWQHYQTALRRFGGFPIKIELLSRFRTPKQQKEILKQLERGEIDLVVGTHRLVSKDVKFKDLGLVIIDEEQRFGVAHKEHLKSVYPEVDILTLSATPIPRTLNMAMSGIRDMSVIEEPPSDRYPVQTYVIEHQQGVLIQAIQKELRRGGQVYYIHNRIETLDACAYKIQQSLPEARIATAHGQMDEAAIEEVWRQLLDHEIDILVCTTIIETGVDVSNCNTLIIEDADRFGLSQLYQLRGRVGRSSRRAYAYFTFRRGKVLTEIAAKRLEAIRELTQFGSGFKIAMRDLEIRGVGSILSAKQHGHMEAVGYDMYLQLLTEAIAEQKGEAIPRAPEDCLIDITIDAFIPESYIEDLKLRIEAYRRIAAIMNGEDSEDVIDELIDRYGEPPKSVVGLIDVAMLRNLASKLGIKEITQRKDNIVFYIRETQVGPIMALTSKYKGRILVNGSSESYVSVRLLPKQEPIALMKEVLSTMEKAEIE